MYATPSSTYMVWQDVILDLSRPPQPPICLYKRTSSVHRARAVRHGAPRTRTCITYRNIVGICRNLRCTDTTYYVVCTCSICLPKWRLSDASMNPWNIPALAHLLRLIGTLLGARTLLRTAAQSIWYGWVLLFQRQSTSLPRSRCTAEGGRHGSRVKTSICPCSQILRITLPYNY
jgi:hypothetical protein